MKKIFKRSLAVLLAVVMLLSVAPLSELEITASAANSSYDIVEFGSYPQSKVTDSAIISKLSAITKNWKSYGYCIGGYDGISNVVWSGKITQSDYMKFADVEYNNIKYRAVLFTKYRPKGTSYNTAADATSTSHQDNNGYYVNRIYYFEYEPLQWRVLDKKTGLIMCNNVIDSQSYNNYNQYLNGDYYGDINKTYFASDWENSDLRAWLNIDFFNVAFSDSQKKIINNIKRDNKSVHNSKYNSASTTDKVTLLSYWDALNSKYGFSSNSEISNKNKQLKSTDYAKCQGCSVYQNFDRNSAWWLRSPDYSYNVSCVDADGSSNYSYYVDVTFRGVVPVLNLEPSKLDGLRKPFTQTRMVNSYAMKNSDYASQYFNGAGVALDGVNSSKSMIIPGLQKSENMVPQGLAYYAAKNQVLISSYDKEKDDDKKKPSMIFALDYDTGKLTAEYELYDSDGNAITGHVGGIATSGDNIYVANGYSIYYIPASNLNSSGRKAIVAEKYNVSEYLNGAKCSYVSVTDNVLWVGNFYRKGTEFKTSASKNYNSKILGFKLLDNGGKDEWDKENGFKPTYEINLPNRINSIQYATVTNGKLIAVSSYGRKNDSTIYTADIKPSKNTVVLAEQFNTVNGLPMMEGFFVKDGSMYSITESAAYFYNGKSSSNVSKNPTDVVWKIDLGALFSKNVIFDSDAVDKVINYTSDGKTGKTTVNFRQGHFCVDSIYYNQEIGRLCSQYTMIGYADFYDRVEALKAIGMENIEIEDDAGKEQVNYFLASRKITCDGKTYTLVFAGFIGSHNAQWYSNFDPGTGAIHKGFNYAKTYVNEKLDNYIDKLGISKDKTKLLITGHSRGAATANLLAAKLIDEEKLASPSNIYTYTFATPNPTTDNNCDAFKYKRIFNIVNPEDFVTKVMLQSWGYNRYGTTYVLPSRTNSVNYTNQLANMQGYFSDFTGGMKYSPYGLGEVYTHKIISQMSATVPTIEAFYGSTYLAGITPLTPHTFFENTLCHFVSNVASAGETALAATLVTETLACSTSSLMYRDILLYFIHMDSSGDVGIAGAFTDAHRAETYCAYMMSLPQYDMCYRSGYKGSVNCPVDIEIYEQGTDELVGRITNNVVDEEIAAKDNAVVMYVDGDSKVYWLPSDGNYDVVLKGNDEGTMDYTVSTIDEEGDEIARTSFFDVDITTVAKFNGSFDGIDYDIDSYALEAVNGDVITPTENVGEKKTVTITTVADGYGKVCDSIKAISGDYVTVDGDAGIAGTFLGWYLDGELVSKNIRYSFVAKNDVTLTAKFSEVFGDLNDDGRVNSSDALLVLQHSVGQISFTEKQLKHADVNNDGNINSSDALQILRYSVGEIKNFG